MELFKGTTATIHGEDIAVAIKALQRSSAAVDGNETLHAREVRMARENRLADKLRRAF